MIPRAGDVVIFDLDIDPGAKVPEPGDEGTLESPKLSLYLRYHKITNIGNNRVSIEAEVIDLPN